MVIIVFYCIKKEKITTSNIGRGTWGKTGTWLHFDESREKLNF